MTLKLVRKLHLGHSPPDNQTVEISDTLATVPFNGPEYTVQSFSEGVAHLAMTIPRIARGVCQGPREAMDSRGQLYMKEGLFHVQCYLLVTMSTGLLSSVQVQFSMAKSV